MPRFVLLPLALVGLLAAVPARAQCTTSWASPVSGNWNAAGNWDNGVPGGGSNACITLDGTYTVILDVNASINSLVLGASGTGAQTLLVASNNLTVAANSTINSQGVLDWQGSRIATGGATLINDGTLALSGAGTKDIGGNTTIRNQASTTFAGTGTLRFVGSGSAFVNAAGATFDLQSDASFGHFNAGNTFTNAGLMRKSGGTGTSVVSTSGLAFDNDGAVEAQVGTLRFDGAGTHTDATFTASAGAAVFFNSGTHTVVGTLTGSPAGAVFMDGGATLTGGTLAFSGTGFEWQSGVLSGSVTNTGLLRLTTSGTKDLAGGATLTNQSLVEVTDAGSLRFVGGTSVFVNAAGATFDLQSDASLNHFNNGNTFTNEGTLRKSGGTGTSVVSTSGLALDNSGTVDAQAGTIRLDGGGTHANGTFTAALDAAVYFNVGTHTVVGTVTGDPLGAVFMDSGATLVDDGSGAMLDFGNTGFEWRSGNFAGSLTNVDRLRLTTSGTKDLNGGAMLTNQALVEMTDAGSLRFVGGTSRFVNAAGATFDLQSDASFGHFNAGNTFTNAGLMRKSGGTGTSVVSTSGLAFDNDGAVEAQVGTLRFDGAGTHTDATFTASAGAAVFFNSGTHTVVGTLTGSPAGTIFLDGGATMAGGTISFGGTGFEWQSGNFGSLTNAGLLRLTTAGTKDLNGGATLTNTGTVEMMDSGTFRFLGGSSAFVNAAGAVFDLQSDASLNHFNGGNTFTNDGTLVKSAGSGTSIISTNGLAFDNDGTIAVQSGTLDLNGAFTNGPTGRVQGTGVFDVTGASVTNDGVTAPGASPGTLTWLGGYAPRVGARLGVELGGLTAGTEHDQLVVAGNATLGGLLKIAFVGGYTPTAGDSFTILTANAVTGTFASVEEPAGWSFDVTYNAGSVVVTAQAEAAVTATLVPQTGPEDGPVVVPPTGGPVRYRARLRNTTGQPQAVQAWIEGLLPNGNVYQGTPLVGPQTVSLNPGQTLGPVSFSQPVPASIPAGVYAIRLRVGQYPGTVLDEDAFVVVKEAAPARLSGGEALAARGASEAAWVVYEVTEGAPLLAERTMTEAAAAALEAAMRAASEGEADAPEAETASAGADLPEAFALHAAYPNPFAAQATLRYDLPTAAHVRLVVYDLLGREVARLVDAQVEAGRHRAGLDGRALAAGVYVVRLAASGQVFTQRLTRVR